MDWWYVFSFVIGLIIGRLMGRKPPKEVDWISVKERLPEEMETVLLKRDQPEHQFDMIESGYWDGRGCVSYLQLRVDTSNSIGHYDGGLPPVTHWMPRPDPPKEAE